ncbi:hypothetical protein NFI96_014553 [Prochilodus magdalenae]|nr:hypothetical protein NFI96_014553 [Prochilodus magdalenae]
MGFILLCVLYFIVKISGTGSLCLPTEHHTLRYLYTLRSAPGDDPEFEITTVFDGLIISHCESPSFRDQSRYDWINQAFTAEEWKNRDRFCENGYYFHTTLKEKIQQTTNTSNSIIQRERSCTAGDSEVSVSDRVGVNAEDFLTLDPNTLKWRSESSLARTIRSEWNQMKYMAPLLKDFQLNQCEPFLMKLKKKKADYLKQNQRPLVYVFAKSSAGRDAVYLRCYVSHKYLPGVRVRLTLDGEVVDQNVNISSPLPNMDGSVQIRLQTETSIKEPDRYQCMVDTDNLHISVGWDGQTLEKKTPASDHFIVQSFTNGWISVNLLLIISVVTVTVAVVVTVCSLRYKKAYAARDVNINGQVELYVLFVSNNKEFERAAEEDDEYHEPQRRPCRTSQDIKFQEGPGIYIYIMSFILLCVLCGVVMAGTEHHTLQYLYTLRSAPGDDPEFEITIVFDGLIISHCESPSFRDQSRYDWINQAFTDEEWKNRDRFCEGEYYFHLTLKKKIEQINTVNGIIQRERSCTAGDSEVSVSDRWGLNAEDFLTLDPNTLKWRSESSLARTIRSEWNQMKYMAPSLKDFQLNQCEPSLMKLKKKKADYLKQNQRPLVYVFAKSSADRDVVYLRCYVSHKYLPGVRVRMTLDGEVVDQNVNISSPLPNMDGSAQIRLQTETSIKEPDRYHCMVDTDNLHISVGWDGQNLNKNILDRNRVSDEFPLHYSTYVWTAVVSVLIVVIITRHGNKSLSCK